MLSWTLHTTIILPKHCLSRIQSAWACDLTAKSGLCMGLPKVHVPDKTSFGKILKRLSWKLQKHISGQHCLSKPCKITPNITFPLPQFCTNNGLMLKMTHWTVARRQGAANHIEHRANVCVKLVSVECDINWKELWHWAEVIFCSLCGEKVVLVLRRSWLPVSMHQLK